MTHGLTGCNGHHLRVWLEGRAEFLLVDSNCRNDELDRRVNSAASALPLPPGLFKLSPTYVGRPRVPLARDRPLFGSALPQL